MELNRTDGTAGGRHGGPTFASGEDDSQSHDESSQHSHSESGSRSISLEDGGRVPGSVQKECPDYDDSDAEENELDYDDVADPDMQGAVDRMKRIDEGSHDLRDVRNRLCDPQVATREMNNIRVDTERLRELDKFYDENFKPLVPQQVSIMERSNQKYLFPASTKSSIWAYDAPETPYGQATPPSPWVYHQQVAGLQPVPVIRTDWNLPRESPTYSTCPDPSYYTGQPYRMPPGIGMSTDLPSRVPPGIYVPTAQPSGLPPGVYVPTAQPSGPPPGIYVPTAQPSGPPPGIYVPTARPSGPPPGIYVTTARPSGPPPGIYVPTARPSGPPPGMGVSTAQPCGPPPGMGVSTARPSGPPQGMGLSTDQPTGSPQGMCMSTAQPSGPPARMGASTAQPSRQSPRIDKSAAQHAILPPGLGMSIWYASQASRAENINASHDTDIVSAILSNYNNVLILAASQEASPPPKSRFTGPVAVLHKAVGMDSEETKIAGKECDEISQQTRKNAFAEKSFEEKMVDLETLLYLHQLAVLMTSYFYQRPASILALFEMAYRVKIHGKHDSPREVTGTERGALAKELALELLGVVPSVNDFPIPYMAGIEVPESSFFKRFKNIDLFDRLRKCERAVYKEVKLYWLTPTRFADRQMLRFCFAPPERFAQDFPYDSSRKTDDGDLTVRNFVKSCAGPPYDPLPKREDFLGLNPAVLRNYMRRFEAFIAKIKENEQEHRQRFGKDFIVNLQVTMNEIERFQNNFRSDRAKYNRRSSGRDLRLWNAYLGKLRERVFLYLQEMVRIAQLGMLLLIKYADYRVSKILDIKEMLKHQAPLFDSKEKDHY